MKIPCIQALLSRCFGIGHPLALVQIAFAPVQIALARVSRYPHARAELVARPVVSARRGLSLIEVMIALTMTLIVLGAMMTAFQSVSRQMQFGRSKIELANRVRNVESTLRSDLSNLTVEPRPYLTTIPPGFLEIVEGPRNDATMIFNVPNPVNSVVGDVDDALSMTIQTKGRLFRGRSNGQIVESPIAEVVWFPVWSDLTNSGITDYEDRFEIRRRVMLVRPDIVLASATDLTWDQVVNFFQNNDLSVRIEPSLVNRDRYNLVPNQLTDLSVRKNRFGHLPAHGQGNQGALCTWPLSNNVPTFVSGINPQTTELGFPNQMHFLMLANLSTPDHVVLTNVTGFDIRVYSPNAAVLLDQPIANPNDSSMVLEPGDFVTTVPGNHPNLHGDRGAFVDLGFTDLNQNRTTPAWFAGRPSIKIGAWPNHTWPIGSLPEAVFDTWTPVYESDGINQNRNRSGDPDQGTDGLDNDGQMGVDDIGERETLPPYNYPIRGIEIRIRTVEKSTNQVHQTTVYQSFVPE